MNYNYYINKAISIRKRALKSHYVGKTSHIGSGFSCADILTFLYTKWLNISQENLQHPDRDRFILSKGHAAAIYYSTLAECGVIPQKWLDSYCQFGSLLGGHVHHSIPGVEVSTGSLGHGLPIAVGMALGAKRARKKYHVVVLISDGEMDAGSNWEAIQMAAAQKLDNLTVIVDRNRLQAMGYTEEIIPLGDLANKFECFGWKHTTIDGHSFMEIDKAFSAIPFEIGRPNVIVANTVKGKGVSFMEDRLEWHYKSPNENELYKALQELRVNEKSLN